MKKVYGLLAIMMFGVMGHAQEDQKQVVNDDTTKIKLGNMTIIFDGDESNENFDFDMDDDTLVVDEDSKSIGFNMELGIGMNGWLNTSNSTTFENPYGDMSLQLNRSRAFSAHLVLDGAEIFKGHLFVSPGFGFTWNNYHFENKNMSISTGGDTTMFVVDSTIQFDKYKLRAAYIEVPLTVGARIGNTEKNYFTIEAGVIGGFNIGSMVKQRYYVSDVKYQNKVKDDFNVNPFKLDAIAKVRINDYIGLYGRYSLTTMFEKNKTQEVYPFSLGITLGGI